MSVDVMRLAWRVADLTPAQKVVLLALADHADAEGGHVYPSVARLVVKTSCGERTVRRALGQLREAKIIQVVQAASHHRSTEYRLDVARMKARQVDLPERHSRPARAAPYPSYNHQDPSEREEGIYIHPDPEPLAKLKTALAVVAVETFTPGYNEDSFDAVAHALLKQGATPEQVQGFGPYWRKNGHYSGPPHLKSIVNKWRAYANGHQEDEAAREEWLAGIATFADAAAD
jgi:hypothetical protein